MSNAEIRIQLGESLKRDFQLKCLQAGEKMTPVVQKLVSDWTYNKEADSNQLIADFLKALTTGDRPSNATIVKVAGALELETDELLDFCDLLDSKRSKPNGCSGSV